MQTDGCWDPLAEKMVYAAGAGGLDAWSSTTWAIVQGTELEDVYIQSRKTCANVSKLFSLFDFSPKNWKDGIQNSVDSYRHVMLDSGVFSLAMNHLRKIS